MAAFVLVHGAFHGGWCWQRVVRRLRPDHDVYPVTLTGLGERSHLLSPVVDLNTHIDDVVNLILWEDLSEVILCGHSYGGFVVAGVADALAARIRAMVYLDAFVPADGDTPWEIGNIPRAEADLQPPPAHFFGLNGADAAWVNARMTPMPMGTVNQAIRLRNGPVQAPSTYVQATGWDGMDHFRTRSDWAAHQPGWTSIRLAASHDAMVDRPNDVVEILLAAAR